MDDKKLQESKLIILKDQLVILSSYLRAKYPKNGFFNQWEQEVHAIIDGLNERETELFEKLFNTLDKYLDQVYGFKRSVTYTYDKELYSLMNATEKNASEFFLSIEEIEILKEKEREETLPEITGAEDEL